MAAACWVMNCSPRPAGWLIESLVGPGAVAGVDWQLNTKYYTALVRLSLVEDGSSGPAGEPEAVVVMADTMQQLERGWAGVRGDPAVRLVVVQQAGQQLHLMLAWCVERQFELIDLSEIDSITEEEEEGFDERTGKERIREALEAHTWSNLILLEDIPKHNAVQLSQTEPGNAIDTLAEDSGDEINSSDEEFGEFMGGSGAEGGEADFESLFANLASLKEKAEGMSDGERKLFAENVAVSFFTAMGGNKDDL